MRVTARLGKGNHAHLPGYLICDFFDEPKRLHFIIDTGCTITTIRPTETERLGIECNRLPSSSTVETATSTATPRKLLGAIVVFQVKNDEAGDLVPRPFIFPKIDVMPPPTKNLALRFLGWGRSILAGEYRTREAGQDRVSYNLLGMDFLSMFKRWEFTDIELILDT